MMKIFFLVSLLLPTMSFAGDFYEMGNGGFIAKCPAQPNQTFDVYETTIRYKLNLDESHRTTTKDRVLHLISKIEKFNPQRAQLYRDWFKTFNDEVDFKTGFEFGSLPDRGTSLVKVGCTLLQVAFQRAPGFLNKYRYTIDADLWGTLDYINQAAIIMHELIYRELSSAPNYQTTSEATRAFNAWINSTDFDKASLSEYLKYLQELNIARAEFNGTSILLAVPDTLTNTWSKLPLSILEKNLGGTLTLDGSQPFKSGSLTLVPQCPDNDKLQTMGVLQASGDDFNLSPIPSTQNFLNCSSIYTSDDNSFTVAATNWVVYHKDQLQTIYGEYGNEKDKPSLWIARYGPITFLPMRNFPVTVFFNMNGKQTPEDLTFKGRACFIPNGKYVNIWRESPMDSSVTWEMDKISQIIAALPLCPK